MSSIPGNLLGETRGRILGLLRHEPRSVNDLAEALDLTDNAVRAQLADLVAENLVVQSGQRPGARKPHLLYELTPQAHELLSRLYRPVLVTLLELLGETLPPAQVDRLLDDVAHRLAAPHCGRTLELPAGRRIDEVLRLVGELGGDATTRRDSGGWVIEGKGCPLAALVAREPASCRLLETFLADLLGRPVREHCTKGPNPQCCFHVGT